MAVMEMSGAGSGRKRVNIILKEVMKNILLSMLAGMVRILTQNGQTNVSPQRRNGKRRQGDPMVEYIHGEANLMPVCAIPLKAVLEGQRRLTVIRMVRAITGVTIWQGMCGRGRVAGMIIKKNSRFCAAVRGSMKRTNASVLLAVGIPWTNATLVWDFVAPGLLNFSPFTLLCIPFYKRWMVIFFSGVLHSV